MLSHPHRHTTPATANFTNLQSLVEALRQQIEPIEPGAQHSEQHIEEIKQLLSSARLNPREWQNYTTFRRGRYTRTLVGFDSKFVALLLCWERGQRSPIHDHAGASCWVKLLSGSLKEVRFHRGADGSMSEVGTTLYGPDVDCDVSYMNDSLGLHQILNPSSEEPAVSLHIYAPPFQQCQIFQPVTGEAKMVSMVAPFTIDAAEESQGPEDESLAPLFYGVSERRDCPSWDEPSGTPSLTLEELITTLRELRHVFSSAEAMVGTPGWPNETITRGSEQELALVRQALGQLQLSQADLERYCSSAHFSEFQYTRNLVYLDNEFSLMLLCWSPGQATPVHTHGVGVRSWFKVIRGALQLEAFDTDTETRAGDLVARRVLDLDEHASPVEEDASLRHHRLSNPSDELPAISVHLYSPPLKELSYRESGKDCTLPVVNYGQLLGEHTAPATSPQHLTPRPPSIPMQGCVYMNFEAFRELLNLEFAAHGNRLDAKLESKLTHLLKVVQFNTMEWQAHASWDEDHFTRMLLAQNELFSLVLTCWDRGQCSPPHDHAGSRSWIKVLQGSIEEVQFEWADREDSTQGLRVSRSGSLATESLTFLGRDTIHSCLNNGEEPCFSLHLYSPPYSQVNFYNVENGQKTEIKIPSVYGKPAATAK